MPTNSQVPVSTSKEKTNVIKSTQATTTTTTTTTNSYTLCYLYITDLTTTQAYKNELNKYGWSVDLVNTNNIGQGNWSFKTLFTSPTS